MFKKNIDKLVLIFILIFMIIFGTFVYENFRVSNLNMPTVKKGLTDLSNWDLDKDGNILLEGEWEFYKNKTLYKEDFVSQEYRSLKEYVNISSKSIGLRIFDNYEGTFRTTVVHNKVKDLAFRAPKIYSPYSIFIDYQFITSIDKDVQDQEGASAMNSFRQHYTWEENKETFDIIIHVDNKGNYNAGILKPLLLGSADNIEYEKIRTNNFYMFYFTMLLTISFVILGFYYSRNKQDNLIYIFFAAMASAISIFFDVEGPFKNILFTDFHLFFGRYKFISNFIVIYFIFEYFNVSSKTHNKKLSNVLRVLTIAAVLVSFVTSFKYLYVVYVASLAICTIVFNYILYISFIDFFDKRQKGLIYFTGAILLTSCFCMDLFTKDLLNMPKYLIIGVLMYCIFIFLDIMFDYIRTHNALEKLTNSLEEEVEKRTLELIESNENLGKEIEARKVVENNLMIISTTDHLTGVFNRMHGQRFLDEQINMFNRYGQIFSLIIIDIDNFKLINDTLGHDMGDVTLIKMTEILSTLLRKTDLFARWGGEEFIIVMPNCTLKNALYVAEKMRNTLATTKIEGVGKVTISLGVAEAGKGDDSHRIVKRADGNLYKAKLSGKNCTFPRI